MTKALLRIKIRDVTYTPVAFLQMHRQMNKLTNGQANIEHLQRIHAYLTAATQPASLLGVEGQITRYACRGGINEHSTLTQNPDAPAGHCAAGWGIVTALPQADRKPDK
jgi:hypothetical protein